MNVSVYMHYLKNLFVTEKMGILNKLDFGYLSSRRLDVEHLETEMLYYSVRDMMTSKM